MCGCDTPERSEWYGELLCDKCIDMELNFDWEGYEESNRKGFDSVADAIDSIGEERKESEVFYNLLCEIWPKNNKPLNQVILERLS